MTLIFAHRGFLKKYPENTLLAFKKAEEAGADGIELDVHLSKDGEVVVIHDETLNRTTNGQGFVSDLTLQEIKNFAISGKFDEVIPSLRDVLSWIVLTNLFINVELKTDLFKYEGIERKVINLLEEFQLNDRAIISSFNSESLMRCYKINPDIETALLYSKFDENPMMLAKLINAEAVHPKYIVAPNEIINKCQKCGVPVRPYTVNKINDLRRLYEVNCAGVITDDPELAFKIRSEIQNEYN